MAGYRSPIAPAMVMLQCFAMPPDAMRVPGARPLLSPASSSGIRSLHGMLGAGGERGGDSSRCRLIGLDARTLMGFTFGVAGRKGRACALSTAAAGSGQGPKEGKQGVEEGGRGGGGGGGGGEDAAQSQLEKEKRAEDLHVPVLLDQVLSVFEGRKLKVYVDGTLGMAGHSCAIYDQQRESIEKLVGIDQDVIAMEHARKRLSEAGCENSMLLRGNFGDMGKLLGDAGIQPGTVDGILLDIGTSSMQLDDASRGFSFMRDGPLDMRMDTSSPLTAAEIVNTWPEEDLAKIIYEYGEEKKSRSIAKKIVAAREVKPIMTTLELSDILGGNKPKIFIKGRKAGLHPATLTFQALRIAVNRELNVWPPNTSLFPFPPPFVSFPPLAASASSLHL